MKKWILRILLFIWFFFIFKETVFRDGFLQYPLFSHGSFNPELFTDLKRIYHNDHSVFLYLFIGNIVTFIPFGLLVLPLIKTNGNAGAFFLTVLFGTLLSLFIEISQWAFGVGVSEVDDLVLNTFGVMLGALICLPVRKKLTD